MKLPLLTTLWVAAMTFILPPSALIAAEPAGKLKVYLLCGQSNMEGHGYTHREGDDWLATIGYPDATSIETLLTDRDYTQKLDAAKYSFLTAFSGKWLEPRTDVWVTHVDSGNGELYMVKNTKAERKSEWRRAELPLQPGFGNQANDVSKFGPELGIGHALGEALKSPIYLFKSDRGGTALATAWRPPSAVQQRGGQVGENYTHTVRAFQAFLKQLDNDLADDGKLNRYAEATGYEICGFVWVHGWNDSIDEAKRAEYEANLVDLVRDVRKELNLPSLPAVIVESADARDDMRKARQGAVAALNANHKNSAVFVPTAGLNIGLKGGFHFEARAENYLELGWRTGKAIIEQGFTGSEKIGLRGK